MATSVEPNVAAAPQEVLLCLDCNYSLIGLPTHRCPECGREFNLNNPKTFNAERPLRWIDRKFLKPIGWPIFTTIALLSCSYLYLGIYPTVYDYGIRFILALILFAIVTVMLAFRDIIRNCLVPVSIPLANPRPRERLALAILAIPFLLVLFHVPLRIVFFLAKSDLDHLASGMIDATIPLPIKSHRVGPISVSIVDYGDTGQHFLRVDQFGGGGFAYCNAGPPRYYNHGTHGHLWGNWYWWTDD